MKLLLLGLLLLSSPAQLPDPSSCPPASSQSGSFTAASSQVSEWEELTVLTLNMASESDLGIVITGLGALTSASQPDILLLQEVEHRPGKEASVAEKLAAEKGYHFLFAPSNVWDGGSLHGLAILSRYPIESSSVIPLKRFDLRIKNRCRIALAATVQSPFDTIRVYNVHLDTRITIDERLRQLEPVVNDALREPGMSIIGGDFNTNEFHWIGRILPLPGKRQEPELRQHMKVMGFQTPFPSDEATFDYLNLTLDSIYFRNLEVGEWGIDPIDFSDHRGLWATIRAPAEARPDLLSSR
jgi:endonuclease/exonuclease/phosphatase family metal-dependent hydrolase